MSQFCKTSEECIFEWCKLYSFRAFYKTNTKKLLHKANIKTLIKIKKSVDLPVVVIGGINDKNYKKLLLNKADFLAISGYIWNNKILNQNRL